MFKKSFSLILLCLFVFINVHISNAASIKIISKEQYQKQNKVITLWEMFILFWSLYDNKIPESYKYMDVKISWIEKNSEIYKNIQKLIYVDVLKNNPVELNIYKKINAYAFYKFAEKTYKVKLISDWEITNLKHRNAIFNDFNNIKNKLKISWNSFELNKENSEIKIKKEIFSDVYKTITNKHYDKKNIKKTKLIDWAIKWLAKATGDKHTVYFPPTENKDFHEALSWEYEWIWSYVEMQEPWLFKIVSPISGSPAEKAWLKWGDIVLKVDKKDITEKVSLGEAVSWIKWPAWSSVILTIKRWTKVFDVEVKRAKIVIKEVESKKINSRTLYVKMKFFWDKISKEFKQNLEILKTDKNIKKIIFDLRGNWGWYLDQVADILWNFAPVWEGVAVVKYSNWNEFIYKSRWYSDFDFSKYKIIVLQNWWTASASEIFIWTLKDYLPKTTIIWEQSYWKGSVQTIKSYKDGSSFKYTIAHWFTWKTQTWINWVGITPDLKIEMEKYWVSEKDDKQLQKALQL